MGRLINIGAYAAENCAYLFLRLDVPEERGCIWAVATVTIVSRAPGLCRIRDDHTFRAIDFCKTSSDAGAAGDPDRAFQLLGEWVVAARIQHKDAQILGLLHVGNDIVDPNHAPQVCLVVQLGIDRHEVIHPSELQRMPGVVKHRHVGGTRGPGEFNGCLIHSGLIEIGRNDDLKA